MFADDCVIYTSVPDSHSQDRLNSALNSINNWCEINNMQLNKSKTKFMQFSTKTILHAYDYEIKQEFIEKVTEYKYLSVTFTTDLKFGTHVSNIVKKASAMLFYLSRHLRGSTPKVRALCYQTYVRPILEYASQVWSPKNHDQINLIEAVQRKAARIVFRDFR